MIIAVCYENGFVFQHFGQTEAFKLYYAENKTVVKNKIVLTNGVSHADLIGFLADYNVNVLICGGIGGRAKNLLTEAHIDFYANVSGEADLAVENLLNDKLIFDNSIDNCSCHHD